MLKLKEKALLAKKLAKKASGNSSSYAFLAFDLSTEEGREDFKAASNVDKSNRALYEISAMLRTAYKHGSILDTKSGKSILLTKEQEVVAEMIRQQFFNIINEEKLDITLA